MRSRRFSEVSENPVRSKEWMEVKNILQNFFTTNRGVEFNIDSVCAAVYSKIQPKVNVREVLWCDLVEDPESGKSGVEFTLSRGFKLVEITTQDE